MMSVGVEAPNMPTFRKKKIYNTQKTLWIKRFLMAASIIIAIIATVFVISQWTGNQELKPKQVNNSIETTKLSIKSPVPEPNTKLAEKDGQKSSVIKPARNTQKKTATKQSENKQIITKPIINEETNKEEKIAEPDFSDLKVKGWVVKKNENNYWEAYYNAYDLTMIYIPPGKFMMGSNDGSNDEKPAHEVDLDGYWIGKYEVTFAQYDQYCRETGNEKPPDKGWGRENRPVIYVSWDDAVAYCRWLSLPQKTGLTFQLPTEAQWEKAARGSRGFQYPWGNDFDKNKCNPSKRGAIKTMPVGTYPLGKSPYGCMDMAGNVWEWCYDWYDEDYYEYSPAENPQGPAFGSDRVLRGSGWILNDWYCRAACRNRVHPAYRHGVGFRLLMSL